MELRIDLRTLADVRLAQGSLRRFAEELCFARQAQWEITIAASEAGTNIVKHGKGGVLLLRPIHTPRPGLRIEARDQGPGILDFEAALKDHVSEGGDVRVRQAGAPRRGLGTGLGAIVRLMDSVGWENLEGGGGLLWAEKYL